MTWNPTEPYNQLPLLPPEQDLETKPILKAVTNARVALQGLNQAVKLIPNQSMLIQTIPILEAKASSEIENIVTTTDNLFRYMDLSDGADPATKEALRYRTALWEGMRSLKTCPISTRTLIDVCSRLRDINVEVRKMPGTYIGNPETKKIIYTPPDSERVIYEKLQNWAEYLNDDQTDIDPLIRMAVAHYQFEAIHPFSDGNGRTGRVVNMLFLVDSGLLDLPVLYLSRYLIEHKNDYYQKLLAVTEKGDWNAWILYMLKAVEETSNWTRDKVLAIVALEKNTIEYMKSNEELNRIYSRELVDEIFARPYCRVTNIVDRGIVQRQAAMRYLKKLCDYGVLQQVEYWREKLFINRKLLNLLRGDSHEFEPWPINQK